MASYSSAWILCILKGIRDDTYNKRTLLDLSYEIVLRGSLHQRQKISPHFSHNTTIEMYSKKDWKKLQLKGKPVLHGKPTPSGSERKTLHSVFTFVFHLSQYARGAADPEQTEMKISAGAKQGLWFLWGPRRLFRPVITM